MRPIKENIYLRSAISEMTQRLSHPSSWSPLAALIPFSFVLIILAYICPNISPKYNSNSRLLPLKGEISSNEVEFWIDIFPKGKYIMVKTSDNKFFHWERNQTDNHGLQLFQKHLNTIKNRKLISIGIKLDATLSDLRFILSVDQRLQYRDILPILYILSKENISSYAFETISPT